MSERKTSNVVVITCDELKATTLSCYGNAQCVTPNIDALAKRGIMYNSAYTPHPLCVPARISLWTSMHSSTHGCTNNERLKPAGIRHAFEDWKARGYRTGLIGKNHCFCPEDRDATFDIWCEIEHTGLPVRSEPRGMPWVTPRAVIEESHSVRKEVHAPGHDYEYRATDFSIDGYSTGLIAAQTEKFMTENATDPFVLWVSFPDPHPPYELPKSYFDMFEPSEMVLPPNWNIETSDTTERMKILTSMMEIDEEHLKGFLAAYYGMTRFIDDAVGRIVASIEKSGLRDRTIVVFTSDHGDFAGEYGLIAKGGVFYDCLTRVPLILDIPGRDTAGHTESRPVSLIDIVPTLFSLQGIEQPDYVEGNRMPLDRDNPGRGTVFSEYGSGRELFRFRDYSSLENSSGRAALMESRIWRESEGKRKMVRDDRFKFVSDPMGDTDELYDLQDDPWETINLAHNGDYQGLQEAFRKNLREVFDV